MLVLRDTETKGRGIFAQQDFAKGDLIESQYSLARRTDGTLWAWGFNVSGQLGQNNTTRTSSPVQIPGTTWNDISAGANHTLARKVV